MASQSAISSLTPARFLSSSSAKLCLPSFQGRRSTGVPSSFHSLRPITHRRASSFFSSSSSCRPLLVTAGELPLVGNEAPDFEAEAVFDQEFTKDGARKALEQAFQGKNSLAKKWEEEIRKRELSGGNGISGGGSGGGGGRGGGGWRGGGDEEEMGEGFGQDEPWDWEEFGQTVMATLGLLTLYISITHGPKQILKKFKLLFRYIRQGFRLRKIPDEYLTAEGSGIPSDDEEVDEDEEDDDEDGDQAAVEFIRERQVVVREANVQKDAARDEETEDDEEDNDDVPTPLTQQSRRGDLLSKRKAEQKEKLLQLLSPKELRQQQEEKK